MFGILAMGEGWHNTHHAFPTSARHGLRWWQIDVSYWVIRVLELASRLECAVADNGSARAGTGVRPRFAYRSP